MTPCDQLNTIMYPKSVVRRADVYIKKKKLKQLGNHLIITYIKMNKASSKYHNWYKLQPSKMVYTPDNAITVYPFGHIVYITSENYAVLGFDEIDHEGDMHVFLLMAVGWGIQALSQIADAIMEYMAVRHHQLVGPVNWPHRVEMIKKLASWHPLYAHRFIDKENLGELLFTMGDASRLDILSQYIWKLKRNASTTAEAENHEILHPDKQQGGFPSERGE